MSNCKLLASEYQQSFTPKKLEPTEAFRHDDNFYQPIEDWQIDLSESRDSLSLEEKKQLVKKLEMKYNRTVYQDSFQNPAGQPKSKKKAKDGKTEQNFERELLLYVQSVFYNPHNEKVLAPPVTSKRVLGYMQPKLFHFQLTNYQDSHGRVGGDIMLQNANE